MHVKEQDDKKKVSGEGMVIFDGDYRESEDAAGRGEDEENQPFAQGRDESI